MNPFAKLFAKTLPPPVRDNDGRYLPHRIAVRRKAIEMAQGMGRDDLVSKLRDKG